jgi:hypothetical protein
MSCGKSTVAAAQFLGKYEEPMELTNGWDEQLKAMNGIAGDRRSDRRYDLKLDLRWRLIRRRRLLDTGSGISVDLSSGGVLFDAGRPMPVGLNIELAISWPVLLYDTAPLRLFVAGRIVRTFGTCAAIQMVQHEFRTVAQSQGTDRRQPGSDTERPQSALVAGAGSSYGFTKYR